MKRPPVVLPPPFLPVVGNAILERLQELHALVVVVAVVSQHAHLLAKMPFGCSREWIGLAKKHAWFKARDQGWTGKLWAKRDKLVVVRTRRQQLNVYRYIVRHADIGAWVWKWSDRNDRANEYP
jgi:hypothetical protein